MKCGLYLVATPIGNMQDISLRALEILQAADIIACEDTRVTGKLLSRHAIDTKMTPYHEHNAAHARPGLIDRIRNGEAVALVTDAGTPSVSDPGHKLVRDCIKADLTVTAIPGANAALTGLILSGLPSDRFLFAGFLANKSTKRRKELAALAAVPATLIFHESNNRLAASLTDMTEILGDRPAAVTRELTKLYEEIRRGSLSELAAFYVENGPPKGEIVIVTGPPEEQAALTEEELDALILAKLDQLSVRDAVAEITAATGLPKRKIYARAVALSHHES